MFDTDAWGIGRDGFGWEVWGRRACARGGVHDSWDDGECEAEDARGGEGDVEECVSEDDAPCGY